MLKIHSLILFLGVIMLKLTTNSFAQNPFNWSVIERLPQINENQKQFGLGGALSGIHSNTLLVAGGSNFNGIMPWNGGIKKYFNQIYILKRVQNKSFEWHKEVFNLPFNFAYSATICTEKGIFCLGGENESGVTDLVFLLKWDTNSEKIIIETLPSLPEKITNASAVRSGKYIYILGGENSEKTLNSVYQLNITTENSNWKKVTNLPIPLSHTVAFSLNNSIYLVGGRAKVPSKISMLSNRTYKLDLKHNKWSTMADISINNVPINALSAASGVIIQKNKFMIIGGDKGNVFSTIEEFNLKISKSNLEDEKKQFQLEKEKLLVNHEGFSRDVLLYHSKTNHWEKVGELPFLTPVTTSSHIWGKDIVIPSGEIKPGVRTVDIILGKSEK